MAPLSAMARTVAASALALLGLASAEEPASCVAGEGPGCGGSEDTSAMLQMSRSQGTLWTVPDTCNTYDSVQCPGSDTMCSGKQCCPGVNGSGTFPCPSAPIGWKGDCEIDEKVEDCVFNQTSVEAKFRVYLAKFNKTYSGAEFQKRLKIFEENLAHIEHENKGGDNLHDLGLTNFTDLSPEEFNAQRKGLKFPSSPESSYQPMGTYAPTALEASSIPTDWDWRTRGAVTPVKDQLSCGSCWSFSGTGALEGAYFLRTGMLHSMSEQQLIDCTGSLQEGGCNGGYVAGAFEYAQGNHMAMESSYPYMNSQGSCKSASMNNVAMPAGTVVGYQNVAATQTALLAAVYKTPVSVAVEAEQTVFQNYKKGLIINGCAGNIDHAVLAVGFGTVDGYPYWLIKNSWGETWGENGYVRILRGAPQQGGMCGILSWSVYPVLR